MSTDKVPAHSRRRSISTPMVGGPRSVANIPVRTIDCDVHPYLQAPDELADYLSEPWKSIDYSSRGTARSLNATVIGILTPPNAGMRRDAVPPNGGTPCSDPLFTDQQLLRDGAVDFAILIPLVARPRANPEHESAVCAATNSWLADTWLSKYNSHGRYRGSIRVCARDPYAAAREIERWAGHPYMVEVMLTPDVDAPFGQPQYYPIYEAAERHRIPIGVHVTKSPGMRLLTPVGFISYHMEFASELPLPYMAHLTSLVLEGVFDKFPQLKFIFIEGGFTWLLPLMWRLDNNWAALRNELPHVRRAPSEYVREHIRVTTQPLEEPAHNHLMAFFKWMGAEDLLVFASDYPHHDWDDPLWILPRLAKGQRDKIMFRNAIDLYGLPAERPSASDLQK